MCISSNQREAMGYGVWTTISSYPISGVAVNSLMTRQRPQRRYLRPHCHLQTFITSPSHAFTHLNGAFSTNTHLNYTQLPPASQAGQKLTRACSKCTRQKSWASGSSCNTSHWAGCSAGISTRMRRMLSPVARIHHQRGGHRLLRDRLEARYPPWVFRPPLCLHSLRFRDVGCNFNCVVHAQVQ